MDELPSRIIHNKNKEANTMPRRRKKKNILTSIALSPITVPLKMTQGIMTATAMVGLAGFGAIIASAASSSKGRKRYRSKWF
jgi:hypothetical protein